MPKPELSIIAPVYNEEACIQEFYRRLEEVLLENSIDAEILFVNDGSTDDSLEILRRLRQENPRIKILNLSRNFGHQAAVKAGIDHAQGKSLVIMDTDLQDPPEVIPDFLRKQKEGYDVVYAVRISREGENMFKKLTASLYYRFIKKLAHVDLPLDTGDFRLITQPVADAVKQIKERNPYLRGLISWVGYKQIGIPINRQARFAGKTKYPVTKMLRFAWNGVTHFSYLPLQFCTFMGTLALLVSLIWTVKALYVSLVLHIAVKGWTSLMLVILLLGSVQLITLGIMGSYLARIYDEARARPLYLVKDTEGL